MPDFWTNSRMGDTPIFHQKNMVFYQPFGPNNASRMEGSMIRIPKRNLQNSTSLSHIPSNYIKFLQDDQKNIRGLATNYYEPKIQPGVEVDD